MLGHDHSVKQAGKVRSGHFPTKAVDDSGKTAVAVRACASQSAVIAYRGSPVRFPPPACRASQSRPAGVSWSRHHCPSGGRRRKHKLLRRPTDVPGAPVGGHRSGMPDLQFPVKYHLRSLSAVDRLGKQCRREFDPTRFG